VRAALAYRAAERLPFDQTTREPATAGVNGTPA